jgi:hypothetical protein
MIQTWEEDVHDCLDRYNTFLNQLEPYPEWRTKMIEEVGKWFLMIHNNLGESDSKSSIFAKLVIRVLFRTGRNTSCDSLINCPYQ